MTAISSIFLAWLLAHLLNTTALVRAYGPSFSTFRIWQEAIDTGHCLAFAIVFAAMYKIYRRWWFGQHRKALVALTIGSCILAALVLPPELSNMSARLGHTFGSLGTKVLLVVSTLAIGASIPLACVTGRFCARPYWRWLGILASTAVLAEHAFVLKYTYHGVHLFMAMSAATLLAASITGARAPRFLRRSFSRLMSRPVRNGSLALAIAYAVCSIGVCPPATVAVELVRTDVLLLPYYLLRVLHRPAPLREAPIPPEMQPWFVTRESHPPIPPTSPSPFYTDPLIIFVTIDCLRADVILSGRFDHQLPTLARLRDSSTVFTQARAAAPGTASSLASVFMGTYFSQQYWTPPPGGLELTADTSPRMPELLQEANIATITFAGAVGFTPRYGILRGFSETTDLRPPGNYATADTLMAAALERLDKVTHEPLFLYLHFLDAHAPYNLGVRVGSSFERYLSELQLVDTELHRLMYFILSKPFKDRTLVIISADHGEAFGEHGMAFHSSTLYDELLHVPLIMWRFGQGRFIVPEPVTLLDVSPTILDSFGLPTPGHFMGQSLVPFLRKQRPQLTRPILAEGRLKQALLLPDGHKVIVDNRLNTVELFQVRSDPQESKSLADDEERLSTPLSLLRTFFQVHTNRTPGYTPPYRVW